MEGVSRALGEALPSLNDAAPVKSACEAATALFKNLTESSFRLSVTNAECLRLCERVTSLLEAYVTAHQQPGCLEVGTAGNGHELAPSLSDSQSELGTHCARCLRNLCANPELQPLIGRSGVIPLVARLLDMLLVSSHNDSFGHWSLVRAMAQLCGNLVAGGCQGNAAILWPLLFPTVLLAGTSCADSVTVNVLCMVVHTCLCADPSLRSCLFNVGHGRTLLSQLLLLTKQQDLEWPLHLGELLVSGDDFLPIFRALEENPASLALLLKLLNVAGSRQFNSGSPYADAEAVESKSIRPEILLFLAEQTEIWLPRLPVTAPPQEVADAMPTIDITLNIIEYISEACRVDGLKALADATSFFSTLLGTLRRLTPAPTKGSHQFVSEEKGKKNVYFGLKRCLMCCVANMLSMDKFKDQLLAENGMELLLSNSKVDNCNPYLSQWCVFAIRNACEKHPGNQSVIAQLKRQGSADVSLLRKMGIDVDVADDGTVKIKAAGLPED